MKMKRETSGFSRRGGRRGQRAALTGKNRGQTKENKSCAGPKSGARKWVIADRRDGRNKKTSTSKPAAKHPPNNQTQRKK